MFLQPLMLFGLAALAIPVIIHLLNRRRYEVVDWGAMRFLQMSKVTRRRIFIEEILLLLLRMALLALLPLAFARLIWGGDWLAWTHTRPNRDVVLIFDGSSSMNYTGGGKTPQDAAKEWAAEYVKGLVPGDGVAVFQARQQVLPVVAEPNRDLQRYVPQSILDMPRPSGGCDLPAAIQAADALLAKSQRGERDVIVLTDGQRFGWSDADTMHHWEQLGRQLNPTLSAGGRGQGEGDGPAPRLWVVNVDPHRDPDPPNWSLDPIRVDFPVIPVQSEVTFHTAIEIHGTAGYDPPKDGLELDVDGQFVRGVAAPPAADLIKGKIPLTFTYRFASPGTHLVTLTVKPDPKRDTLPDDNRQDFVVEVTPPMPIVYVDGNPDPAALKTGEQTLLGALALEKDTTPALRVKAVSIKEFKPELLTAGADGDRPRVLVLCNVAGLNDDQRKAVEDFLGDGGGVLVTLGGRVDKDDYNLNEYRDGTGWLPARLTTPEGDETRPNDAAHVAVADATHPIMARYRSEPFGGLADARFPKWWKVDLTSKGAAGERAATLRSPTGEFPFLVERRFGAGRVLLSTVPLDDYWGTNLTTLPDFVPLVHDLVYYLAGARAAEFNLQPGQPIRYRLASSAPPVGFRLQTPLDREQAERKAKNGEPAESGKEVKKGKPLIVGPPSEDAYAAQVTPSPHAELVYEDTRQTGVYELAAPDGRITTYVSQPDPRESDLTSSAGDERSEVAKIVPMQYESDRTKILTARKAADRSDEWGPIFLVGMIALLCVEVWMTRRMVKNRS